MALQDTLEESWQKLMEKEFDKAYWKDLDAFVASEREANPGKIYPPEDQVFAALNFMPYEDVHT